MKTFVHDLTRRGALALGAWLALGGFCYAATQNWQIDESQSSISLVIPDQDVVISGFAVNIQFRNQIGGDAGPWNVGNTAAVAGQIVTDYVDGASIQFIGVASSIAGLDSGSYRPNPAVWDGITFTDTSTAPGVYGARVRGASIFGTGDAGFLSFRNVLFELDSAALGIGGGGAFAANTATFGMQTAELDVDGLNFLGLTQLDDSRSVLDPFMATNAALGGMVDSPDPIGQPLLRRLTMPIDMPFAIDFEGTPLMGSIAGTLVATTLVPEPSGLALAAIGGLSAFAWIARRKRNHSPVAGLFEAGSSKIRQLRQGAS